MRYQLVIFDRDAEARGDDPEVSISEGTLLPEDSLWILEAAALRWLRSYPSDIAMIVEAPA